VVGVTAHGTSDVDALNVAGSVSSASLDVSGTVTAGVLVSTEAYSLCNSTGACINQYPEFMSFLISYADPVIECPQGWVAVQALTHTLTTNPSTWIPLNVTTGSQGVPDYNTNHMAYLTCMYAGVAQ
jgi:hypothetical protein